MTTFTGAKFWPLDARPHEVRVEDIVHALALMNRFNGHSKYPFSVAQHCLLVASMVPPEVRLEALLHDATEAYLPDMVRPLKQYMPEFQKAEDDLWFHAIAPRFQLVNDLSPYVHRADLAALAIEASELLADSAWADRIQRPADWRRLRNTYVKYQDWTEVKWLYRNAVTREMKLRGLKVDED